MSSDRPADSFASLFESSPTAKGGLRRFRRGERLDVTVVAVGREAVFVDLGGKQEGYFDRGEVADKQGKLFVDVGSSIQAIVVEADGERVKLSPIFVRKADGSELTDESGETVRIPGKQGPLLLEGAHVRGVITGVERYGVFVQIDGTQGRHGRGLVPTSETATPRGADLKKVFPVGGPVEAKILAIAEDGKIRLSIKALADDAERKDFADYQGGDGAPAAPGAKGGKGKPAEKPVRGFGTLGDLLGKVQPSKKR